MIAGRQFHIGVHFADGVFDRRAQVAPAHRILDGDVALPALAIDLFRAVVGGDMRQLRQRDALATGRQQANILDGLAGVAILLLIAQRHVEARLALLHLRQRIGAHGGLHRVLNVGHVDAPARRRIAVHGVVQIGLADDAEDAQVLDALSPSPSAPESRSALCFQRAQIVAIELDGKFALHAAHGLFHVVGDGLRIVPDHAGKL